ncbi:hypothetical protein JCM10295v2_003106 [Rhodotorula toruloides]
MVRLALVALAAASAVLAIPASSSNSATTVVDAFRALRSNSWTADAGLAKRQSTNDVINGLQALLEKAMESQGSISSKCHSECGGWYGLIEKCADHDSYYQIGLCACGSGPIDEMKTCGKCFGGPSSSDATDFGDYCQKTVASTSASASPIGITASIGGFGGPSGTSSRSNALVSATSAAAAGSATQQTPVSSASSPAHTAGTTGAAGTIKIGAGVIVAPPSSSNTHLAVAMTSLEDFDRQVKALVTKGKLSSSAVDAVTKSAMANVGADSLLVSTLYRHHKKATPSHKLTSLYLIDAVAREARSRQRKADKEGKGKEKAAPALPAGSTTPSGSPPPDDGAGAGASGDGTFATFLKKLEAVLGKIVLDNWENGLPEHKEKVRKVLDIWTKASTFSSSTIAKISSKLLATASSSAAPAPASQAAPSQAALEQKKQEDMESEVERVLREAKEGSSSATHSAPPPAQPQQAPYSSNYPSASSSSAYSTPSYHQPPPAAYHPPSSSTPIHPSHQYAAGYGSSSQHPPPLPAQPPYQASSYPQQYQQPPQQYPPPQQHQQQPSSYPPPQQQQPQSQSQKRTLWDDGTSHASNGGGYQSRPGDYERQQGPTRSYDPYGRDEQRYGDSYGRREEPPAKRPYQPPAERASQPKPSLPTRPPIPSRLDAAVESYSTSSSTPARPSTPSNAPPPSAPSAPAPAPTPTLIAPPFDPTTFDATSPASWTAFVGVLRAAHPYFASLGRMPHMEEVMSLCAPVAMLAFGTPGAGGGLMGGAVGGMGAMRVGGEGEQSNGAGGTGGAEGDEYSGNDGQAY